MAYSLWTCLHCKELRLGKVCAYIGRIEPSDNRGIITTWVVYYNLIFTKLPYVYARKYPIWGSLPCDDSLIMAFSTSSKQAFLSRFHHHHKILQLASNIIEALVSWTAWTKEKKMGREGIRLNLDTDLESAWRMLLIMTLLCQKNIQKRLFCNAAQRQPSRKWSNLL